ncbi:MAG TPA: cache and HAMP domain-containing protein [Candidatus Limnocylindria bacterium]|nr:cache and HAMP domain-containing protein [Candidatus Limnocylindria bacterium]
MLRVRFWQKVLVALMLVGVVPIALVSAISIQNTRDDLTQLGVTNIRQRALATSGAIDAYLESRLGDIVLVSRIPDVVRHATYPSDPNVRNAARDALKAAAARSPEYESVAYVGLDGKIMTASIETDDGTSIAFRTYFLEAKAGRTHVSDPSYSVITNRPALFFSAPVRDPAGAVLGVVRTRVNLAAIWDLVEADAGSVGAGAHGFLVDDHGIRLAVSETKGRREIATSLIYKPIAPIEPETAKKLAADRRFGTLTPEQLVVDPLPELKAALGTLTEGGAAADFAYRTTGEDRGVVVRLAAKPWAYVLTVPLATYTKAADDATFNAAAMVAVGVLLAFVIGILLTRSLVAPLRRLVRHATRVSTGDVDLRVAGFDTRTGDDITREVAAAFERLLNALRFYAMNDEPAPEPRVVGLRR